VSEAEVLEVGRTRRAGPSRRVRLVLLAGVVLVAVAAFVVDRELRVHETQAVAACADEVTTAVDLAGRRVATTYEYVRPALANSPRPTLRNGLYGLVADAAQGADSRLEEAATTCGDVWVLVLHDGLRDRRDRCIAVVEEQRARLTAVAADGENVQEWLQAPRRC
jgi:hypothetical protein